MYAAVLAGAASGVVLSVQDTGQTLWTSPAMSETSAARTLATRDVTPARVLLVPRRDLIAGSEVTSNTIRLSGITVPVGVAASAGTAVSIAGGPFLTTPQAAERGEPIVLRATAPAAGQTASVTLTTGTVSTVWTITSTALPAHTHQTLYGPWGACSADQPCDGLGSQSRDILCLRSDGRFVAVGACDPGLTATESRSCPSPAGQAACAPMPALADGAATQFCAAGSTVRGTCTGFTCPAPYAPRDGACVSTRQSLPVITVTTAATIGEAAGTLSITASADYGALVDLVLPISLSAGSQADAADLPGGPWSLTIPAGQTFGQVSLTIADDTISEADETLMLQIGAPASGATLAPGSGLITTTIVDDDTLPEASLTAASGRLPEDGTPVTLTVQLSRASSRPSIVGVRLPAALEWRAALSTGELAFAPGQRTATLELRAIPNGIDEPEQPLTVTLEARDNVALGTPGSVTVILEDDEGPPVIAFAGPDQTIAETGGVAELQVTLSHVSLQEVSVGVVVGGTAGTGDASVPARVAISARASTALLRVTALDDLSDEADETVTVTLTAPVNGVLSSLPGDLGRTVTIADDDEIPGVSVTATAATVAEGGTARFTVSLDGPNTQPVTVPWSIALAGTLTASDLLDPPSGQVTFAAGGASSQEIAIRIADDTQSEAAETLTLSLGAVTGGVARGAQSAAVTIAANDAWASGCEAVLAAGNTANGTYVIDTDGPYGAAERSVFCENQTLGGGWTRIAAGLGPDNAADYAPIAINDLGLSYDQVWIQRAGGTDDWATGDASWDWTGWAMRRQVLIMSDGRRYADMSSPQSMGSLDFTPSDLSSWIVTRFGPVPECEDGADNFPNDLTRCATDLMLQIPAGLRLASLWDVEADLAQPDTNNRLGQSWNIYVRQRPADGGVGADNRVALLGTGAANNPWRWDNGRVLTSCTAYGDATAPYDRSGLATGVVLLRTSLGVHGVQCDMTTRGGGWARIAHNVSAGGASEPAIIPINDLQMPAAEIWIQRTGGRDDWATPNNNDQWDFEGWNMRKHVVRMSNNEWYWDRTSSEPPAGADDYLTMGRGEWSDFSSWIFDRFGQPAICEFASSNREGGGVRVCATNLFLRPSGGLRITAISDSEGITADGDTNNSMAQTWNVWVRPGAPGTGATTGTAGTP